ncbi:MAG: hypothetical protein AVO39_00190 [delta proteobacterium MLS_D]|jgi:hypothetical protein|nr:MAG: hypothetical protein AVO39_00190 [delta proteobacterium MLS_D]
MSEVLRRAVQDHLDAWLFTASVTAVSVRSCPARFPLRPGSDSDWNVARSMVDDVYPCVGEMLAVLQTKTDFNAFIWKRLRHGVKIMFRPAAGSTIHMDDRGGKTQERVATLDAGWIFTAAVMRWFHDHPRISYYDMCLGVSLDGRGGGTGEAWVEGGPENVGVGWGFYCVRRYLAEMSDPGLGDDPLRGLRESAEGLYLPPGAVFDRMMVYDLNRRDADMTRERELEFPEGGFLTVHKVLLGGDPGDAGDRVLYPGSIPVNLVKLEKADPRLIAGSIAHVAGNVGTHMAPGCKGDALLARAVGEESEFMLHLVDAGTDGILGFFVSFEQGGLPGQ